MARPSTAAPRLARRFAALAGLILTGSLLGALATAMPAHASGSVSLIPPSDAVLYKDCYDYTYGYAVAAPTSDWDVDITITDPVGAEESSDYVYDAEPSVGTETIYLCGGQDRPGTYTMTAMLTWYDADSTKHIEPAIVVRFTLARSATKTTLNASTTRPAYNRIVVFKTKSLVQGRLGYSRLEYEKVRLEGYVRGAWRRIDTTITDSDGLAKFRYRWNTHKQRVAIRAVTLGTATWSKSTSAKVVIRVQ